MRVTHWLMLKKGGHAVTPGEAPIPEFEVHLFVGQLEAVRMTIARPDMATAQEWATKLISGSFGV